jgi:hypothetical protein
MKPTTQGVTMTETTPSAKRSPTTWLRQIVTGFFLSSRNLVVPAAIGLLALSALAADTGPVVEPYKPEDFAFLDQGKTIPWADPKTMATYVEKLKSFPKGKDGHVLPPHGEWFSYNQEIGPNHFAPDKVASYAPVIASFKRQLEAVGVDFLYLPIAEASMVHPEVYWPEVPRDKDGLPPQFGEGNRRLFAALEKEGVPFVNLAPPMILAWKYGNRGSCRQFINASMPKGTDTTHWTRYGVAVSAHAVANEIRKRPWYAALPKLQGLKADWVAPRRYGPNDDPHGWKWERRISGEPVGGTKDAPILVVGDSNMENKFGFPRQLMFELGVPVEVIGGMSRNPSFLVKRAQEDPDWLLKKKLVIWSLTNRAMGWPGRDFVGSYTLFPKGVEDAKKMAASRKGMPSAVAATVVLEENSTAKTPAQWQPYTQALIVGRYRVENARSANEDTHIPRYPAKTLMLAGWGLLDGKQTWLAKLKPGERFSVTGKMLNEFPELAEQGMDMDALEDFSMPIYVLTGIKQGDGKTATAEPLPKLVTNKGKAGK